MKDNTNLYTLPELATLLGTTFVQSIPSRLEAAGVTPVRVVGGEKRKFRFYGQDAYDMVRTWRAEKDATAKVRKLREEAKAQRRKLRTLKIKKALATAPTAPSATPHLDGLARLEAQIAALAATVSDLATAVKGLKCAAPHQFSFPRLDPVFLPTQGQVTSTPPPVWPYTTRNAGDTVIGLNPVELYDAVSCVDTPVLEAR